MRAYRKSKRTTYLRPKAFPDRQGEVVAECEELTLYANGWLEPSPKVERALWRATLRISDRKGSEERLELALALLQLAEHAAGHRRTAPEDLLERLSGTLGKMLIPMLSTPQPNAAEKKAQEAAAGIKNVIASLTSATLAIAAMEDVAPRAGEQSSRGHRLGDAARGEGNFPGNS